MTVVMVTDGSLLTRTLMIAQRTDECARDKSVIGHVTCAYLSNVVLILLLVRRSKLCFEVTWKEAESVGLLVGPLSLY